MEKTKDCKRIFEEYQELEAKTFLPVSDFGKGKMQSVHIKHEDLFRRDEVREELRGCLEFLSDEQLKFLYNDDDSSLVEKAIKVLGNRRLKNK